MDDNKPCPAFLVWPRVFWPTNGPSVHLLYTRLLFVWTIHTFAWEYSTATYGRQQGCFVISVQGYLGGGGMWKHGQTICINYEAVVGPDTSPPKRSLYVADVKLYYLFNLNYFSLLTACVSGRSCCGRRNKKFNN